MATAKPKKKRELDFTAEQKIEILTLAKKKLGAGGKNWTKRQWFAKNPRHDSYYDGPVGMKCKPSEATCFCLEGAVEIAAYELGYVKRPFAGSGVAKATSIFRYVKTKKLANSVNSFNDRKSTSWKDVLAVINGRIRELQKESS